MTSVHLLDATSNVAPTLDSGPRGLRTLDSDPGLSSFVSSLNQPDSIPSTMRSSAPPMPGQAMLPNDRPFTPPPLDPSEMLPTAPRRLPNSAGAPRRPGAEVTAVSKRREPSTFALKPWMVVVALILVAGVAALVVALSGPNVPSGK